jgi:hypothetical protein
MWLSDSPERRVEQLQEAVGQVQVGQREAGNDVLKCCQVGVTIKNRDI